MKSDINVPTVGYKQKNLEENNLNFFRSLRATEE
jgi:hypothetical protein